MRRLRPLLLLSLGGCAALKPRPADPGFFLLPPSAAGVSLTLTQQLGFSHGAARFDALAVVEISSQAVALAGLGPFGNRMLSLRWDGAKLESEIDASLPRQLPARLILRDLQLVYWPAETVSSSLPPEWSLRQSQSGRELLHDGTVVISIRYQGDRFRDPVEFEHKSAGYKIAVKTLEVSHD